jgi:hypothetical protein
MPGWHSTAAPAARLVIAWFVFWAGFWLSFFSMIFVADPDSLDPGEPAAFTQIFSLLGIASGILWAAGSRWRAGAEPGIFRCACWGAVAAAAPLILLGKPGQVLVLAPVGAATGATLACLARAGFRTRSGGPWAAVLRFVSQGFGAKPQNVP